uniref:Uncharacterized protein n=1 Tax=Arundo donax TaxID=35708 RepID=A0A0A9U7P9_ARUDO
MEGKFRPIYSSKNTKLSPKGEKKSDCFSIDRVERSQRDMVSNGDCCCTKLLASPS